MAPPNNMLLRKYDNFTNSCTNPGQTWGCGYTYGFRVPLLVVSAYTPAGYVSGSIAQGGPGKAVPYIHDFGSVLAFIEKNFGLGFINVTTNLGYADRSAPDNVPPFLPLADFFSLTAPRSFTSIQPAAGMGPDYFTGYFQRPENQGQLPEGPDGDDAD
ncbi:MAG: alkaline phosphatase family protein [Terriglobales bacterium]